MIDAPLDQNWNAHHTSEATRQEFLPVDHVARRPLLDKRSYPHPILNLLMDEALRRILLVSDGAVMALKERTSGSRTASAPTSDLATIIDQFCERFSACRTHRQRILIIKEAQETGNRLRYAPDRSLMRGTKEWKDKVAADPRSCRVLADVYGVSKSTISTIKKSGVSSRLRSV